MYDMVMKSLKSRRPQTALVCTAIEDDSNCSWPHTIMILDNRALRRILGPERQ
jgi:hypothetical protein